LEVFDDAMVKAKRCTGQAERSRTEGCPDFSDSTTSQEALSAVESKMRALTTNRRKGVPLLRKIGWSLYHRKALIELKGNISKLLDSLECFVPVQDLSARLVAVEVTAMRCDEKTLEVLAALSNKLDSLLHDEADRRVQAATTYQEVIIGEKARVHNGGHIADNYQGAIPSGDGGCSFGRIHAKGNSKTQNGWRLGGKDFFDD
jgi:hypothetical protein